MTSDPIVAARSTAPANILVVDDMTASRYITASWLRRSGHLVTEATTGAEALSVVAARDFDLVLLDVHLPDMSGFEVCERIKADERTSALPVIHVSATYVDAAHKTQGLTRGADAYLTEPVDPGELLATVEAALRYHRARVEAERLALRLTRLTEATLRVNSATSFDALLRAAAGGAAAVLDAGASVFIPLPDGRLRVAAVDDPGASAVLRSEPLAVIERLASSTLGDRVGAEVTDGVVVARTKAGRPPVGISVPPEAAGRIDDRNLLLQLGQATALASEALRALTEEHALALTLQRSLLPQHLPEVPGVPMAVRYVPASRNAEIGGDFYEVTELDDGVLIAIGDVAGHSIEAATIMGEVRHALRAYAVEGHGLVAILDRLDAMLRRFHPTGLTTLCLLLLDVETGEVAIANAGHIPPLAVTEDGAYYLDVRGPLLGVGLPRPAETRVMLERGTTVVLMTDGLLERRGVSVDEGMAALRMSMTADENLEVLCDRLVDSFGQGRDDDIALIAFGWS